MEYQVKFINPNSNEVMEGHSDSFKKHQAGFIRLKLLSLKDEINKSYRNELRFRKPKIEFRIEK